MVFSIQTQGWHVKLTASKNIFIDLFTSKTYIQKISTFKHSEDTSFRKSAPLTRAPLWDHL